MSIEPERFIFFFVGASSVCVDTHLYSVRFYYFNADTDIWCFSLVLLLSEVVCIPVDVDWTKTHAEWMNMNVKAFTAHCRNYILAADEREVPLFCS